jgi:hypothetical protein
MILCLTPTYLHEKTLRTSWAGFKTTTIETFGGEEQSRGVQLSANWLYTRKSEQENLVSQFPHSQMGGTVTRPPIKMSRNFHSTCLQYQEY